MSSANLSSKNNLSATQIARFATLALVGIAYFLIAVVALHFLRPDSSPIRRTVSEYAVGQYGFLMISAFFGLGLGSLALVIGLYLGISASARSSSGLVLLGIWGLGILIAGIFRTDLKGAPGTLSGAIHALASVLSFFSLIPATLLLSRCFSHDRNWQAFKRSSLFLSLVVLATFIGFIIMSATEFAGLGQRIFILSFVIWLLLTAARLRFIAITFIQNDEKGAG